MTYCNQNNIVKKEDKKEKEGMANVMNNSCSTTRTIYYVFHVMMVFIAVYMSFKCNDDFDAGGKLKFNWTGLLAAIFFPYIYIIYNLARKGTCGIFECSTKSA